MVIYPKVIIHNYDPEYNAQYYQDHKEEAKEYYEQHKKLKGRSTSGLNDEGKMAAAYLKNQLETEKTNKTSASEAQRDADIATAETEKENTIAKSKTEMEESIKQHSAEMQTNIDRLNNKLKKMSSKEKAIRGESLKNEITALREKNAAKKEELKAAYQATSASAKETYKTASTTAKETHKTNTKQYKEDYENKYADALDSLLNDSRYKKTSSSKKSSSSSSSSGTKKTNYSLSELRKMTSDYKNSKKSK